MSPELGSKLEFTGCRISLLQQRKHKFYDLFITKTDGFVQVSNFNALILREQKI